MTFSGMYEPIRVSSPKGNVLAGKKKSKSKVKNSSLSALAKVIGLINFFIILVA